jgi:hypothetical protein
VDNLDTQEVVSNQTKPVIPVIFALSRHISDEEREELQQAWCFDEAAGMNGVRPYYEQAFHSVLRFYDPSIVWWGKFNIAMFQDENEARDCYVNVKLKQMPISIAFRLIRSDEHEIKKLYRYTRRLASAIEPAIDNIDRLSKLSAKTFYKDFGIDSHLLNISEIASLKSKTQSDRQRITDEVRTLFDVIKFR